MSKTNHALEVRTGVRGGKLAANHSAMVVRTGLRGGARRK